MTDVYDAGGKPLTEITALWQRWGYLKTERASWWAHWKELSDYILPRSGRFFIQDRNRGYRRNNNIYDSTATRAMRVLAAGLMSGATSPARPWFRYATSDADMMKSAAVREWCNTATKLALDICQKSNIYRSLQGAYEELAVFGTYAMVITDDFDSVVWSHPFTCGEYAIATDFKGVPNTLYREFEKPVSQVVGEFGKENCSNTVQQLYARGQLDTWVPIVHAIEPRKDRDATYKDAKNKPFKSCYFELGRESDKYLREGGFDHFPALCPRWSISGGDIYGNSPGMESLGDIKQLQHEQLRKAEVIDYQTKPPLILPPGMKNIDVNRLPGGISFGDSNTPSAVKSMFDVQLNLQHLLEDIQDVRERIKSTFYTDMFLMLQQGQQDDAKTATEVSELHEEKLLMLGPVLERLHNELFAPLIEIIFKRMITTGILPPPPPELHGQELNIEFISMLAQAQRSISTSSVDKFVMSMGTLAQIGKQDVLDKFDSDKWADAYSDMLGIDPELIVPDAKVALIRKERAKQQQQQQQMEQANQASETAKNLAQSPTDTKNGLTDATSAFSGYS